ncbi:hypothetical protein FOFC_02016 [Fusarium oxysporum]|nr:hypothetical protein FOFC_02016 [Fusarium oxysporum]
MRTGQGQPTQSVHVGITAFVDYVDDQSLKLFRQAEKSVARDRARARARGGSR